MPFISTLNRIKNKRKLNLKHKIYFSISSEGLGHSSRVLAIAKEFQTNEILIGSYNYALDRINSFNLPTIKLKQELQLVGKKGAFDVGKTIIKNHAWALKFNKLIQEEVKAIKDSGASCVVADGRIAPVMAAEKLGLPCVVITNQSAFYPFFAKDSALIRVFGRSFDWIMKTWLSSTEEIIIPDFPPPYTICLPNLSRNIKVMKRTRFVGPLVSWDVDDVIPVEKPDINKPYVVVTLGGHSYRRPIFDTMLEVARIMPEVNFDIFTSFNADKLPDNVTVKGVVNNIANYMKAADIVITQAGHSTAMELLTLGKPSVIIPDLKQIEQENNASRMQELGVSKTVVYDELSCDRLMKDIKSMLSDSSYSQKAEAFSVLAKEIQGRQKAAAILRDYSSRLQKY